MMGFMEAVPLKPVVVETARIENLLLKNEGYRDALIDLTRVYRDDANIHFLVAFYSFRSKNLEQYAGHAEMEFTLSPEIAEYRLFAGITAYYKRSLSNPFALSQKGVDQIQQEKIDVTRRVKNDRCWW